MASNISQGIASARRVYKKKPRKKSAKKKGSKRKTKRKGGKKKAAKRRKKTSTNRKFRTKGQIGRRKRVYTTPAGATLHVDSTAKLVKRGGKVVKKTETHAFAIRHGRRVKMPKPHKA